MSKKQLKVSVFEIVWYALSAAIAVWGITYIVLGMIGDYSTITATENELAKASAAIKSAFGLGFFHWGLILTGIGAVSATIVLLINAKKSDREVEKAARRAARLSRETSTETVVEAK